MTTLLCHTFHNQHVQYVKHISENGLICALSCQLSDCSTTSPTLNLSG